jgi:hypothetical protein
VHGGHVPAVDPVAYVPPPFRLRARRSGREWDVIDGLRRPGTDAAAPVSATDPGTAAATRAPVGATGMGAVAAAGLTLAGGGLRVVEVDDAVADLVREA